ncbi:hypothetical protein [Bernardetia sp.]|uniref:hypothetical protein n=1 Tax=Bernardetia sp. TaxID=1937974 RepID=UPI0025BACE98|nr:hypothetical protein [Bernardetia sp.]
MQEYDFLPYVFTEQLYYIDAVESEWKIEAVENQEQEVETHSGVSDMETNTLKQEIEKVKSENTTTTQEKQNNDFSYFGKNRKNFLILINETEHDKLNEVDNKLLTGILAAGQLSLGDVAIVNMAKTEANFLDIYKKLKPTSVVSFGVDTKEMGVPHDFELYKPTKIKAITWIISHNFVALHTDKTKKLGLWTALKALECYTS